MKLLCALMVGALLVAPATAIAGLPPRSETEIARLARLVCGSDSVCYAVQVALMRDVDQYFARRLYRDEALRLVESYTIGTTEISEVRATFNNPCGFTVAGELEATGGVVVLTISDANGFCFTTGWPFATLSFQGGRLSMKSFLR